MARESTEGGEHTITISREGVECSDRHGDQRDDTRSARLADLAPEMDRPVADISPEERHDLPRTHPATQREDDHLLERGVRSGEQPGGLVVVQITLPASGLPERLHAARSTTQQGMRPGPDPRVDRPRQDGAQGRPVAITGCRASSTGHPGGDEGADRGSGDLIEGPAGEMGGEGADS